MWGHHPRNLPKCLAAFMIRLRLLLRLSFITVYITVSKQALQVCPYYFQPFIPSNFRYPNNGPDSVDFFGLAEQRARYLVLLRI